MNHGPHALPILTPHKTSNKIPQRLYILKSLDYISIHLREQEKCSSFSKESELTAPGWREEKVIPTFGSFL